jgi:hypothetical protein
VIFAIRKHAIRHTVDSDRRAGCGQRADSLVMTDSRHPGDELPGWFDANARSPPLSNEEGIDTANPGSCDA